MITRRWLMDEWRDAFIQEARLREVAGSKIGEALAEIDTHCADSGQSPDEAFGDPVAYAGALARDLHPDRPEGARQPLWKPALLAFATFGGMLAVLNGANAVAHDLPATVTAGQLLANALGIVGICVIADVLTRSSLRSRVGQLGICVAVGAGIVVVMLAQILWRDPVFQAPGWVMLAIGTFLLAIAWWPIMSDRLLADRIIDPRTGREPFRVPPWILVFVRFGPPAVLLCAVVLTVFTPASPR